MAGAHSLGVERDWMDFGKLAVWSDKAFSVIPAEEPGPRDVSTVIPAEEPGPRDDCSDV